MMKSVRIWSLPFSVVLLFRLPLAEVLSSSLGFLASQPGEVSKSH